MPLAVLGLGSNIQRRHHLTRALDALATLADPAPLRLSPVYESPAVGFEDDRPFYNLVVAFETELSLGLFAKTNAVEVLTYAA